MPDQHQAHPSTARPVLLLGLIVLAGVPALNALLEAQTPRRTAPFEFQCALAALRSAGRGNRRAGAIAVQRPRLRERAPREGHQRLPLRLADAPVRHTPGGSDVPADPRAAPCPAPRSGAGRTEAGAGARARSDRPASDRPDAGRAAPRARPGQRAAQNVRAATGALVRASTGGVLEGLEEDAAIAARRHRPGAVLVAAAESRPAGGAQRSGPGTTRRRDRRGIRCGAGVRATAGGSPAGPGRISRAVW